MLYTLSLMVLAYLIFSAILSTMDNFYLHFIWVETVASQLSISPQGQTLTGYLF